MEYLDIAALDVLREDIDLAPLLARFREKADSQARAVAVSLAAEDWNTIGRLAHSLKGMALSLGALPLAELCHQLEDSVKSGNMAGAVLLANNLSELARRTGLAMMLYANDRKMEMPGGEG